MKIAIVGAHQDSKYLAPYDDPSWDIWSCSFRNENDLPRHDLWFELHPRKVINDHPVYRDWLKHLPALFMQEEFAEYPEAKRFPIERVVEAFGPYFLTNSIAHMMALALLRKPAAIGLWGISASQEYAYQKFSILHFVQAAFDQGVEIVIPDNCQDILEPPPLIPGPVLW